jgi:hypothetical protein
MRLPWHPTTAPERNLPRRGRKLNGVHAVAIKQQLARAKAFALAEDLASALDALGDAEALAQELGRDTNRAGLAGL